MLYLFLPVVLILGIYTCYRDMKTGIISNKLIIALLLLGILYQALSGILFANTFQVLSTVLYGFLISLFLWWLGLWPGGDAKLFTALLLALPQSLYSVNPVIPYLANTFVPVFLFMVAYVFLKSRASSIRKSLTYSLDPYKVSFIFIILVGFMWFFTGLINLVGIQADYFITILLLFAVYELFSITISAKSEVLFMALAGMRVILDFQGLFTLANLYFFLFVAGAFIFFRFFLLHLAYYTFTTETRVEGLKPGMIPAEGIYQDGKAYSKLSLINSSLIEFLQQKKMKFVHSLDQLAKKDVERIKSIKKAGKANFRTLRVCQTQPFAAFILIGYILTLLVQGGLITI